MILQQDDTSVWEDGIKKKGFLIQEEDMMIKNYGKIILSVINASSGFGRCVKM